MNNIDLSDLEIIDFHVHMPLRAGIQELMDRDIRVQSELFHGNRSKSTYSDDPNQSNIITPDLQSQYANDLNSQYRMLLKYSLKSYQYQNIHELDKHINKRINEGFTEYIQNVLRRENIESVLIDLLGEKKSAADDFPQSNFDWIFGITPLLSPLRSIEKGLTNLDQVIQDIDQEISKAIKENCVGFKSLMGYYRTIQVDKPDYKDANKSFKNLSEASHNQEISSFLYGKRPIYQKTELRNDLKCFEDYIFRHLIKKAGKDNLLFLIHTGAQYSPNQNLAYSDPSLLFSLLHDPDTIDTKIIMLHAGAPFQEKAAYITWQFPNVYVDLSHTMRIPGRLDEILKTFISISPANKILYGSDTFGLAEWMGFSAYQIRRSLSRVLPNLSDIYEWNEEEILQVAKMILSENSRKLIQNTKT